MRKNDPWSSKVSVGMIFYDKANYRSIQSLLTEG